eukprot:4461052-Pyramimonas_sp.AAC.1
MIANAAAGRAPAIFFNGANEGSVTQLAFMQCMLLCRFAPVHRLLQRARDTPVSPSRWSGRL